MEITLQEHRHMIAEAAYYRAEKRGFGGDPWEDWLEAEAEIDARIGRTNSAVKWAELQEREIRLRAIMNAAAEGIITTDEQGAIEELNPAAERLFGYAAREAVGRNVSMLMASPRPAEHESFIARYGKGRRGKVIAMCQECTGQRRDAAFHVALPCWKTGANRAD